MVDQSYNLAMRNPVLSVNQHYQQYPQPTTRLTVEQQAYQQPYQQVQQVQTDPYTDYLTIFNSCNDVIRDKILQDERYIQSYVQCENLIKQTLYAQVIPSLIQTQQGRIYFEQLHTVTRTLKDEYVQQDVQKEKDLVELEKRLNEKEKQINEMLSRVTTVVSQEAVQPVPPVQPVQNQHTHKNKQTYNQNNKPSGAAVNE